MNLDSSKSSGPDCILVKFLQHFKPELSYRLAELLTAFNMCLKESCFSNGWNVSSVVPLSKNVEERPTAEDYRPVKFLSLVSKAFEKIIGLSIT